jgi:hypothetical protein
MHNISKIQSFLMLQQVVDIVTLNFKWVKDQNMLFSEY